MFIQPQIDPYSTAITAAKQTSFTHLYWQASGLYISIKARKIGKYHVFTDLSSILLSYNSIFIIKPVIRTAIFAVAH